MYPKNSIQSYLLYTSNALQSRFQQHRPFWLFVFELRPICRLVPSLWYEDSRNRCFLEKRSNLLNEVGSDCSFL